jgi:hypothetical protein
MFLDRFALRSEGKVGRADVAVRHSDRQRGALRGNSRIAVLTALLALTALAVVAEPGWEKKNWTTWSTQDCAAILSNSPWATSSISTVQEPGQGAFVSSGSRIQLASALPVRQASAREFEIQNNYDKASAETKKQLDVKTAAQFFQPDQDKIVVTYSFATEESGKPSFRAPVPPALTAWRPDGVLLLSDGSQVISLETTLIPTTGETSGFKLIFPRFIDGQPVIKPGDKKLTIDTGVHEGSKFIANDKSHEITFDLTKMVYHGKLEY